MFMRAVTEICLDPGARAGRGHLRAMLTALCLLGTAVLPVAAPASPPSIVAIDFVLQDDMIPGPGGKAPGAADVARRTRMVRDFFVEQLAASENFSQLALDRDSDGYRELINASGRLFECKRCIVTFGEQLGSDYVLHGWVQRVSNLIINLNVEILEVASGKVYDRATVDTRGNTDKSWMDGASYLLRHLQQEL